MYLVELVYCKYILLRNGGSINAAIYDMIFYGTTKFTIKTAQHCELVTPLSNRSAMLHDLARI